MQRVRGDTIVNQTSLATSYSYDLDLAPDRLDRLALQPIYTDATPVAKTFISGVAQVDRITFDTKGNTTDGDYFVLHDYLGGSWAIALDTIGTAAATPTGAAWVAVAAANKAYIDISGATSGDDVEALVATAINALTGFTAVITTANSTTHLDCTNVAPGLVTDSAVYSQAGASGTGSITRSRTTAGTATKVSVSGNTATIASHGFVTGMKFALTTGTTLPAGLSATNYYAVVIDANTIKFATSLANAVAASPTVVDITDYGVGTHTITPTALGSVVVKLQASNDGTNFTDITNMTVTIAAAGNQVWDLGSPGYRYVRILHTPSAGVINLSVVLNGLSDWS
jgi:hypothetical protein